MTKVDARGLSCPQPVLLTKKAIASGESSYEVVVDNKTACGNVTRFAKSNGFKVSVKEADEEFTLTLEK